MALGLRERESEAHRVGAAIQRREEKREKKLTCGPHTTIIANLTVYITALTFLARGTDERALHIIRQIKT